MHIRWWTVGKERMNEESAKILTGYAETVCEIQHDILFPTPKVTRLHPDSH